MADSDANLIVRLTPLNERTRSAWKDPHNTAFYVHPSFQGSERREASSRQATPFSDDIDAQDELADSESEIRLTLDKYPKELTQGYVFGKDKRFCDIYCGEWSNAFNISGRTFSIAVNKKGQVVLKYLTPKSIISVQYGNQEPGVRAKSTWILFRGCKDDILVKAAKNLEFRVIVPEHYTFGEDYKNACCEYVTNVESAVAAMPNLTMDSQPVTADPSRILTPNTKRFYYRCKEQELGRGTYGKVYLVYDASTGEEYAGKEFHSDQVNYGEGHILAQQDHAHIVRWVDFTIEGGPLLVMHYVRGGNIARPWRINDQDKWTNMEICSILYQCLLALAYLHSKPTIVHRDIKPENLLVERRYPWPWVKLGDFGFAVEGSKIGGRAGTWTYTAPEVFFDDLYTPKVDIWSLGVVVMQMLLAGHLPKPRDGVPHGAKWCADIESFATTNYVASEQKDRRSLQPLECSRETALWEFIMTCMLKVDPEVRLSAEQCLEAGRSTVFRYFGNLGVEGQRAPTPRQRAESSSVPTASEKGKAPMRIEKAKAPMRIEKAKAPIGVDKGKAPIRVDKSKAPIRVDKGKAPIRVARAADSEKAATRQDRPIRPLIAAKEVVNLEQYNSAASEVVYNPGVDETEVWKDQGSQGAATARPTAERAGNEPTPNDWRFLNLDDYWPSMDQHVDKGPAKEGFSDAQQFTAVHDAPGPSFLPNPATSEANTAQNQAPDLALIHQLRDNYGGALMNWMKS